MIRIKLFFATICIAFFCISCHPPKQVAHVEYSGDGYDAVIKSGPHDAFERLIRMIHPLQTTAYYDHYLFALKDSVRLKDINPNLLKNSDDHYVTMENTLGTATIIYARDKLVAISCAHIVDNEDTITVYHTNKDHRFTPFIQDIAIKKKQVNNINDIVEGFDIQVLAKDKDNDLVLLGKPVHESLSQFIPVFNYPLGDAAELNWGTCAYMLGFPSGKKMLTSGIVSDPDRGKNHGFILDSNFNRGFSGGIVVAVRNGLPNFELVGMVNSGGAEIETGLAPAPFSTDKSITYDEPYTGDVYLHTYRRLINGLSYSISVETINDFIKRSRSKLKNMGYNPDQFFK